MTAGSGSRTVDAGLCLLDRQIVDCDGALVAKVDDLAIEESAAGFHVVALLCGPTALGPRLGGRLGVWVVAMARRLRPGDDARPFTIPLSDVRRYGAAIELRVRVEDLPPLRLEQWLEEKVVAQIPGSGHAPK